MFELPNKTPMGELELYEVFEFFDFPRLFSAKSKTGSLFLGLSIFDDYDNFEWLYIAISPDRIKQLINQQLCLYTAFTNPENNYLFKLYTTRNGTAKFEYILPEQLSLDELPIPNTRLKIINKAKPYGLGEINPRLAARSSARETFNIHLYPWDTKLPELSTRNFGNILVSTQELIDSLGQACEEDEPSIKGAISADILKKTKLNTCQIFEGSFGVQFKSSNISDLFGESLVSNAINEFLELLSAQDSEDVLSEKLHKLKGRVASKYRRLLKEVNNIGSGIKFEWGSPNSEYGGQFELTKAQVEKAHSIVDSIDIAMSEAIEINAKLIGLNVRTKRYEISGLENGERFSGKVSEDTLSEVEHAVINSNYIATLKKIIETKSSSGDESIKWVLVGLKDN
ncbi:MULTISPECIES: DUF6575 domain-containing protein [Aeromonas]|uniref:DUF6575 domain-containing protein n=1 Tax=Aeromonas TaxID=642 RepID=UPI001A8C2762|nr:MULTISPECIES: DUF6575 domain-containing protein [Aeromonas]MBQ4666987.1 hypothetical protein [Aeromonas hydrophila]MBQ4714650.1 hypothetical protein [Aeromonas hydrophila]MBW3823066.1 hypothetical protein [Aeromonas hydrophila]MBW5268703.1 hypothetical protein [Aeromonas hydrophila]QSR52031.1 hypothetical protein GO458_12065 [Aeromonas hydrophila]